MSNRVARLGRWLLFGAVAFSGGVASSQLAQAGTASDSPYDLFDQLANVLVLVERQYVEPVDRRRLVRGAIKGMVAELDPHSAYLPARDYAVFRGDTAGRFGGVGVEVDFDDDYVTVIAPIEGSPAERAGILSGDRIVAIDGRPVRGQSSSDLVKTMRGEPGTEVSITVRRDGHDNPLFFTLEREVIHVASVAATRMVDDVMYLRVKSFQKGTHRELLEAVARFRREVGTDPTGVLLDLRSNPGGLVDEAVGVADEFLTGGVIYTTRHRDRVVDEVTASSQGALRRGPVVVLVNPYSASAAELIAGALQDQRRATVVGSRTFGKGSVQSILDLPGGDGLRLTTMRYYTPAGRSIQALGIDPDVRVDSGYLPGKSSGVLRENDLDNHLPAEGVDEASGGPRGDSARDPGAQGDPALHLGVARNVPRNPVGGDDLPLSVAFQILRGVLAP